MEAPLHTAVNSVMLKGLSSNWEVLWSREAMNVALHWGGWPQLWSRWEAKCQNKFCTYRFSGPVSSEDFFFECICIVLKLQRIFGCVFFFFSLQILVFFS